MYIWYWVPFFNNSYTSCIYLVQISHSNIIVSHWSNTVFDKFPVPMHGDCCGIMHTVIDVLGFVPIDSAHNPTWLFNQLLRGYLKSMMKYITPLGAVYITTTKMPCFLWLLWTMIQAVQWTLSTATPPWFKTNEPSDSGHDQINKTCILYWWLSARLQYFHA